MFESTTKSCTQNGVRGGSSTTHFPFWHKEIEDIIVLKNNRGTDDNRVRKMDYSIQFCRLFYRRFVSNENITLFSPHEVKDLYEAFGHDNDEFERLYEQYERSRSIWKKQISARDFFNAFCQERIGTGRMYVMNIDHCNDHSSFLDPIRMSNLCQEITLPTKPLAHIDDGDDTEAEIALCVLSAINVGRT
jgi:ribonucleoside-diphosphate reductase alpha chain